MEFITGNPFFLVVCGGVISAILVAMYLYTQEQRVIPFIGVAILLTLLPILIDVLVVTERESLQKTVHRLASAVRHNDLNRSLTFVHPDAPGVFERIEKEMPTYKFSVCNVTGIKSIEFENAEETEAEVKFTVFVNVQAPRHGHEGFAPRGVTLNMRKTDDGTWKIVNYKHYHPHSRKRPFHDDSH